MTKDQRTQIEAAAFRGLMKHLQERTDVQNIDLMNLAGFCRNCLSKWYAAEAQNQGLDMDYNAAQKEVYGMPITTRNLSMPRLAATKLWYFNHSIAAIFSRQRK
jgi:hypothetical protein